MLNVNWQQVALNLRRHYGSYAQAARAVGVPKPTIRHLCNLEQNNPRLETAIKLLDAHYDACPDRHNRTILL